MRAAQSRATLDGLFDDRCHEAVAVARQRGHTVTRIRKGAPEQQHLLRQIAFFDLCSWPDEGQDLVLRKGSRTVPHQRDQQVERFGRQGDRRAVAFEASLVGREHVRAKPVAHHAGPRPEL